MFYAEILLAHLFDFPIQRKLHSFIFSLHHFSFINGAALLFFFLFLTADGVHEHHRSQARVAHKKAREALGRCLTAVADCDSLVGTQEN